MANIDQLRQIMKDSGMTTVAISKKSGIERKTLYNKLNLKSDFTASEIIALTETLRLTQEQRDYIFLTPSNAE